MQMTSTLWGIEQYFQYKNKSLFDEIRLPNGVDKKTLVNTILVEAGEFEVIYTNGDFLKVAINTWFERKYNMIDRWIKAINIDYKPLENYNRVEKWTDKSNGTTSNNGTKNSTTNNVGTDTLEGTTDNTITKNSTTNNSGSDISEVTTNNTITKNSTTSNSGTDTLEGTTANTITKNSTTSNSGSENGTDTNNETVDNTSSGSSSIGAQTSSDETKVSAFNTEAYTPSKKDESNVGARTDTTSGTGKTTTVGTLTKSNSYSNESKVEDKTSENGTVNNTNTHSSESTVEDTTSESGTVNNTSTHSSESLVEDTTSESGTINNTNTHSSEITVEDTTSDNGTSSNNSEHTGEIYGNIGVTTSQQMLESEITLWGKIDIYRDTAEMFIQDFCIMIY